MTQLIIPSEGALDLVSLGALVHRLDPGIIPFRKATECRIYVSGGEFNVAANLSDCFRMNTAIVSAMVDYPIGDLIAERVRALGVRGIYKRFVHDGVTGPNMATVYSDQGLGVRAPVVFYNRCNEAAARLGPGDFDWDALFSGGVRWFHCGGIFASLSETTARSSSRRCKPRRRPEPSRASISTTARSSGASGAARTRPARSSATSSPTRTFCWATRRISKRAWASEAPR